jgi:hypothetical protein
MWWAMQLQTLTGELDIMVCAAQRFRCFLFDDLALNSVPTRKRSCVCGTAVEACRRSGLHGALDSLRWCIGSSVCYQSAGQ